MTTTAKIGSSKNQKLLLAVAGAGGVLWYFSSTAKAAAVKAAATAPKMPSTTAQRSTNPLAALGNLLKSLGSGSFGGGGSGFSAPGGNAGINPGGDRPTTGPGSTGYVPGPGAPGFIDPSGDIVVGIGSDYGPQGIFVDYQAQSDALSAQLAAASSSTGDSQGFIADALANPPAGDDGISAAGDPLDSHPLFTSAPSGDDGFGAPVSTPIDNSGFLVDSAPSGNLDDYYASLANPTDGGLVDPGSTPSWWGDSTDSGTGFTIVDDSSSAAPVDDSLNVLPSYDPTADYGSYVPQGEMVYGTGYFDPNVGYYDTGEM